MGVFDDKKFENLDWISQATEPIDSRLNEVLGSLPEELIIDFETYQRIVGDSYSLDLSIDRAVSYLVGQHVQQNLSWEERNHIHPCFEFQIDEGLNLDFEKREISGGTLKLVKIQNTMDEKVLEGMLGREGVQLVGSLYLPSDGVGRAKEIMELLGKCEEGMRTRSERKIKYVLRQRLLKLFKDNEWKIKDTELANKVGRWIHDYIREGNLAALSNFCRLKVMTHKDQPIYSMEEVE